MQGYKKVIKSAVENSALELKMVSDPYGRDPQKLGNCTYFRGAN